VQKARCCEASDTGNDTLVFHWLSVSLVVAAVLQYLWFRRVAWELGRYWILAAIIIHVLGVLGAIAILTIMLVGALFQIWAMRPGGTREPRLGLVRRTYISSPYARAKDQEAPLLRSTLRECTSCAAR